ncbi:MAG: sigma-70 family RNA polymerase sigma factor [Oscillospiraceae bacterium]|nr:sigma-70 family RNA polymerase sigma factor [Oscillospiraceae bacterium]
MNGEKDTATIEITPELLERAKAKDRDALTDLYHASSLELYRTVHALVRDEELARDVQQDAYLQAFSHLDQLRDPSSFLPWLRQIAVNEARAKLRKNRLLLFSELSNEEDAEEPVIPDLRPEAQPEAALDRKETTRLVREILNGMPDGQRLIIGMYYYEQIPINQIAEQLELSPGTVKVQLHRGRKHVEREVQRLEAKGVKLYGLSPLPFLLALLKRTAPAAETERALLAGTLGKAGVLAETAAVQVGRGFFQTALGRVALGILTAAAIGGGIWGYTWVRDNLMKPMGDVQPTEQVETAEDLSTEPSSSETLPVESSEELTTEPATEPVTEPETAPTAEPESTGPAQTEPAAPPPTQPKPTEPRPTEPKPTELKPVETERPTAASSFVKWEWNTSSGGSMNWTASLVDGVEDRQRILLVYVDGDETPEIATDDPSFVKLQYSGGSYQRTGNVCRYGWVISPLKSGSAQIMCRLGGKTVQTLTVSVPEYPDLFVSSYVRQDSNQSAYPEGTPEHCVKGHKFWIYAVVQGNSKPEFTTDNPSVIQLGFMYQDSEDSEPGLWTPRRTYYISADVVGTGDATVYLKLNGKIEAAFHFHAEDWNSDASSENLNVASSDPG